MIQVVYTNSKCSDLWDMFIKQNEKHVGWPLVFITDEQIPNVSHENQFIYTDDENYSDVWIRVLKKLNVEQFIYLQEDFILYDDVKKSQIADYSNILKNDNYSFVRLIKSGNIGEQVSNNLYKISYNNPYIFAMQATIWKTKDYINILENVNEDKWLETDKYRKYMFDERINGLCHFNNEQKRGGNHHDSSVYPYIATALVKGKWIMSEYPEELEYLLNIYNLDKNLRGII